MYMINDCVSNTCYFSTHARLAKLETTSAVDCSNPTDSLCSRQMRIYIYFFKVKILIIYYSSIIIVYMAPHCPLVVLFSCFICYHSCRFWYTSYSLFWSRRLCQLDGMSYISHTFFSTDGTSAPERRGSIKCTLRTYNRMIFMNFF